MAETLELTLVIPPGSTPAWAVAEGIKEFAAFRGAHVIKADVRPSVPEELEAALAASPG